MLTNELQYQARVQGGRGGQGAWLPPPPRNRKAKKVIKANFKLFHLHFATFLVGNIVFSAIF